MGNKSRHLGLLQVLRGFAATVVLVYHVWGLGQGRLGGYNFLGGILKPGWV